MDASFWEPVEIEPDVVYGCKIGAVTIRVKYALKDWYLATEPAEEDSADRPLKPVRGKAQRESSSWQRWTSGNESPVVQFVPALPDKPVVVRPEASIKVPSKQQALFFVGIPLWIRITAGENRALSLCEVPTVVLSKTWFGDTISGELGFALRTRAMRDLSAVEPLTSRATCAVSINNVSAADLDFQRLSLHVENLGLFRSELRLWTDQVNVTYRGEGQVSQIGFSDGPPQMEGSCERIADPRVRPDKNLLKKSFQVMRMLTGLEGL
jgi:hypothetical protein